MAGLSVCCIPAEITYHKLYDFVYVSLRDQLSIDMVWSITPLDIYQRPDDDAYKQITFRFSVASHDKTMTDVEVSGMLDKVATAASAELHAWRV